MKAPATILTVTSLLADHNQLCAKQSVRLSSYICDPSIKGVATRYLSYLNRPQQKGFNIFQLISDQYKKENFHSDVVNEFINPDAEHGCGELLLQGFIKYLNTVSENKIHGNAYANARAVREHGRIDIAVLGTGHAVIIENKINNAVDMERQLIRYKEFLESKGYIIDAIIYLVLNGYKQPAMLNWSAEEQEQIRNRLICISAYDGSNKDLVQGWIQPSLGIEELSQDVRVLLTHYMNLLKLIGGNIMNKPLLKEFMQTMLDEQNFETAMSIKTMITDLVYYRRDKIIESFKTNPHPFNKVADWYNVAVFDQKLYNKAHLAIDLIVEEKQYKFQFFDRHYLNNAETETKADIAGELLLKMGLSTEFTQQEKRREKIFLFPKQEAELYAFISSFKEKLASVINEQNN